MCCPLVVCRVSAVFVSVELVLVGDGLFGGAESSVSSLSADHFLNGAQNSSSNDHNQGNVPAALF